MIIQTEELKKIARRLTGLACKIRSGSLLFLLLLQNSLLTGQVCTCNSPGSNLIANGDFESNWTSPVAGMIYSFSGSCSNYYGTYGIGNNPKLCYNGWNGVDHTFQDSANWNGGNGNPLGHFLIVDPNNNAGTIYSRNISVCKNTHYNFSFWAKDLLPIGDARPSPIINIKFNGITFFATNITVTKTTQVNAPHVGVGRWQLVSGCWYSGTDTSIVLEINNFNTTGNGNDLGIDDISFTSCFPDFAVTGATICNGQTATLTASGGTDYTWSPATGLSATTGSTVMATTTVTTTYTVTSSNGYGCASASALVTVTVNSCGITVIAPPVSMCAGNCASLSATGFGGTAPYTYFWSTGESTQAIQVCETSTSTYTVTTMDATGLSAVTIVTVNAMNISAGISNTIHNPCTGNKQGSSTVIASGGSPPYSYSWSTVPVQAGQTATGLATGSYSVTVTDANGCTGSQAVTITEPPLLTETALAYYCDGDTKAWLYASKGNSAYQWFDNGKNPIPGAITDSLIVLDPLLGTIYYVQYINPVTGCLTEAQVSITDNPNPNILAPNPSLWTSNVFTPNGDGKNDFFELNFPNVKEMHLEVYDRWGLKLFETDDIGKGTGWNGKYKNKDAPDGVYYWIILYNLRCTKDGSMQTNHGFVHLFRN